MSYPFWLQQHFVARWIRMSSHWLFSKNRKSILYCIWLYEQHLYPHPGERKKLKSSDFVKGSRQWESRGIRNVSNCPNLARTAAIEVRFSLNFAVVFDFIYFCFRPSKAKSIGNVLPNRQKAAKRAQEICRRIKDGYTCAAPIYWRNDACCANR